MDLKNISLRASTAALIALLNLAAAEQGFAFPLMNSGLIISEVENPQKKSMPTFIQDHEDINKVYMVWDRVYIQSIDDGSDRPQFGLTYNEQGGLLGITVAAGFSEQALRMKARFESEGKRVAVLQPSSGVWQFTIQKPDGTTQILNTSSSISTSLPSSPVALSLLVDSTAIAYVVQAFKTGAGVGVNYTYKYRGMYPAASIRAKINWSLVRSYISTQNVGAKHSCRGGSVSGTYKWLTADASGKLCEQSTNNIRKITQTLIENRTIKISNWTSVGPTSRDYITKKVAELITAMTFSPTLTPSTRLPDAVVPANNECQSGGDARTSFKDNPAAAASLVKLSISYCNQRSHAYVYDEELIFENREYEYNILDQDLAEFDGAVGTHFGDLCEKIPNFFIHTRTGSRGCPTVWDHGGIKTPADGAPAPASNATSSTPVVVGLPPPIFN